MPLPEGTVVDNRYVILHQLGVGGMGTVYKANDRELDRTVALKVIHVELIANEDARKRFAREGRVLASIQHPHVLQSYRVGFWQNKWPYIAMEFLQGHSLHQFANQPLPAARAINIAIQVCGAMQAAHQCGIVHRDLSINNIMLLDNHHNDYIKVIDFGLSFFSGKTTQSITETGALVGSLYYMSPEQCNGQKIDHRADIYALGCILFQLVAGVAPFQADNPIAMLKQHLHACAPPLNTLVPEHEIPVGLQSALCRAMNKNPEQRFQSMQDFQTELEAILRGEGLDVDVDVGEADAGAAKRLRRFGLVAAILCSAGLILTGYLYRLPDLSSAKVGKHPLYKRNKTESELQKMDSDSRIENHKEWLRCHTNEVSERAAYKAVSLAEEVQGSTPETAGKYLREAFAITHRWLEQSLEQEQYSQIQGATNLLQKCYQLSSNQSCEPELRSIADRLIGKGDESIAALNYVRLRIAETCISENNFDKALTELDKAQVDDLRSAAADVEVRAARLLRQTECLWRLHRNTEARKNLTPTVSYIFTYLPNNNFAFRTVQLANAMQEYDVAIECCKVLESTPKTDTSIYCMHAECLAGKAMFEEAFAVIYNNASKMELKTSGVLSRLADMETRGKLRKARELKQFITNRLNGLSGDAPACLDIVFALAVGYRLRHLDAEEREILTCVYPLLVHTPVAGLAAPKTYMKFVDCTSEMMEMKCFSDTEQVLTYIIDHTQDFDTAQFRLRPAYEHLLLCYQRQANVSAIDKLADKVLSLTIDRSNKDNCLFLVGVLLVREEMFEHDARFDQAKACLEEAQSLTSRTGSKQHQVWCHLIDGRLKLEMNKLNEAEVSLNAANSVLARLKLPKVVELTWKLRIYSKLVKAYSLQHKRQLCVFCMKAYLDIGRQLPEYRKAVLKQGIKVYTEIGDLTAAKKLQKELTDTQYSTPAH